MKTLFIEAKYDKPVQISEKIEEKLQNENFVKNATEGSIQKEKTKLEEYNGRLKVLEGYLRALS